MDGFEVIQIKRRDIKGAYVIDGFPSVGLVGSIAASYLVGLLELEQIAVMDSTHFPAVSLVRGGKPLSPVRIYAGEIGEGEEKDRIVVLASEFQPLAEVIKPLAKTIMDWVVESHCKMVISPEGMLRPPGGPEMGAQSGTVVGAASTDSARVALERTGIDIFETGVIVGLAGVLLNEGVNRDFDVVCLLSPAHAEYPDARAAASVIAAIDRMLLHVELDTQPLIAEAEAIEDSLREMYKNAGKEEELSRMRSIMYG